MAVRLPSSSVLQFPTQTQSISSSYNPNLPQPALTIKSPSQFLSLNLPNQSKTTTRSRRNLRYALIKAIEEGKEQIPKTTNEEEKKETLETSSTSSFNGVDELGAEIKEAMKNIKEKEENVGGDFWSGVSEEIKEIEWPVFGKVLGITGVVLGVIAGSSVVLLTLNAVLAEFSDQVFAGKGVQDFFG